MTKVMFVCGALMFTAAILVGVFMYPVEDAQKGLLIWLGTIGFVSMGLSIGGSVANL